VPILRQRLDHGEGRQEAAPPVELCYWHDRRGAPPLHLARALLCLTPAAHQGPRGDIDRGCALE